MRIIAKINSDTRVVVVQPDEPVNTLIPKLNIDIAGKNTNFIYRGKVYDIRSCETFAEIGMKDNKTIIMIDNSCLAGGPPEHICPYGCGRMIPDGYKGCTELLQERPNYFN